MNICYIIRILHVHITQYMCVSCILLFVCLCIFVVLLTALLTAGTGPIPII